MSFALTTRQIRERTKTVTRRLGWRFLKAGDLVCAVVKSQGLKKGEKVERLATLRIVSATQETLETLTWNHVYGRAEAEREGFASMGPEGFVAFFCEMNGCKAEDYVTRIEFEYA